MEKTDVKFSGVLGIYFLIISSLLCVVTVVAVIVFQNMTAVRADDTEKKVETWIKNAEATGKIDTNSFPENADYVAEKDGEEIASEINDGNEEKLRKYISQYKSNGKEKYLDGQEAYMAKKIGDSIIYIHYSVGVSGEWTAFGLTALAYILVILVPSVVLINRLKKLIYTLAEEKWRKDYETKQEMAQIAHDLKTPLTIIRGNADLLLEKDPDEDSKESIDAIISSAERIAKSVLEILEK